MKSTNPILSAKIAYIQNEIWKDRNRFRFVTKQGIQLCLEHPPFRGDVDARKLSITQLRKVQSINDKLMFPLAVHTIVDIVRIGEEYDKMMVDTIEVGGAKKPPKSVKPNEDGVSSEDSNRRLPHAV